MSSPTPAPDRSVQRAQWDRKSAWSGLDQSGVMGVELLAAVLLWSGLGYLADGWLGTTPWLFAVGALGGFAAGLYLVILRANRLEAADAAARGGSLHRDG